MKWDALENVTCPETWRMMDGLIKKVPRILFRTAFSEN
jgi:hypothetical protein